MGVRELGAPTEAGKDKTRSDKAKAQGAAKWSQPVSVSHKDIPGRMNLEYSHGLKDANQRTLDGLRKLLARFQEPEIDIERLMRDAADLIWRQLGIDNVAIGLKDSKDGLYRYKVMVGFREDATEGHKRIAYTKDQFFADSQYVGTDIGNHSRLYLAEDNPLTEEERRTYNRPGLLTMKRQGATDSLEGDYVDTRICGINNELLGWIEISGTRTLKLPDASTIRWVETIAEILAAALISQKDRKGSM